VKRSNVNVAIPGPKRKKINTHTFVICVVGIVKKIAITIKNFLTSGK
jgi:hypothetical protein